jgi:hypothetical protein
MEGAEQELKLFEALEQFVSSEGGGGSGGGDGSSGYHANDTQEQWRLKREQQDGRSTTSRDTAFTGGNPIASTASRNTAAGRNSVDRRTAGRSAAEHANTYAEHTDTYPEHAESSYDNSDELLVSRIGDEILADLQSIAF